MDPDRSDRSRGASSRTVIRDFLIFQTKLIMDGAKDVMLFNLSVLALLADLLFRSRGRRPWFYAVLELSERFDLWLNLHGPARDVGSTDDGLFGASPAGSPTFLGRLEELIRGGDEPRRRKPGADGRRSGARGGGEERRDAA